MLPAKEEAFQLPARSVGLLIVTMIDGLRKAEILGRNRVVSGQPKTLSKSTAFVYSESAAS